MTDADANGATADPPGDQEAGDGWTLPVEAGWLLTAVAALAPAWGLRGAPGPLYEEGFTVLHAELVLQGQTPGVDFHALYGPLGPWLMAGWFKLVGPSIGAQRVVGALLLIAIVLGVRQLLRPWGRNVATAAAVVTSITVYSAGTLVAVAWWFGLAAVLWGVLLLRSPAADAGRRRRTDSARIEMVRRVVGGLLFGLALGFRPDLAVAVLLAGGATIWAGRRRAQVRAMVPPVAAGFAAGLLPLAIYTLQLGVADAWRVLVTGPFARSGPIEACPRRRSTTSRASPRPPPLAGVAAALAAAGRPGGAGSG
ncbi:MAG: hypothetical protein R2704_08410 [Microthrixaceae bacterium]